MIDYLLGQSGFLGTRASLFIDIFIVAITIFPLFGYISVILARNGFYQAHRIFQWVILFVYIYLFSFFEFYSPVIEVTEKYLNGGDKLLFWSFAFVAISNFIIVVTTPLVWIFTLINAEREFRARNLPGGYTLRHIRAGRKAVILLFLSSFFAVWFYIFLYLF